MTPGVVENPGTPATNVPACFLPFCHSGFLLFGEGSVCTCFAVTFSCPFILFQFSVLLLRHLSYGDEDDDDDDDGDDEDADECDDEDDEDDDDDDDDDDGDDDDDDDDEENEAERQWRKRTRIFILKRKRCMPPAPGCDI